MARSAHWLACGWRAWRNTIAVSMALNQSYETFPVLGVTQKLGGRLHPAGGLEEIRRRSADLRASLASIDALRPRQEELAEERVILVRDLTVGGLLVGEIVLLVES